MTDEIPVTTYIYEIAKNMKDGLSRVEKKLDDNTEVTNKVLAQATKTNGRVTGLESWSDETKAIISTLAKSSEENRDAIGTMKLTHHSDKLQVMTAGAVFTLLIGGIAYIMFLYLVSKNEQLFTQNEQSFETNVSNQVISSLQQNYNVKVTQ